MEGKNKLNKKEFSRRNFLKGAVIGTAGIATMGALTACSSAKPTASESSGSPSAEHGDWLTAAKEQIFKWREKPEEPQDFAQTLSADVVVCGAGLAGLCAARSAAENGAEVIVIENDETYDVHGFQCAAVNPRMVKEVGAEIDKLDFFNNYIRQHGLRVNYDLIRTWVERSGEAFDWYEELMPPRGNDYKTNYRAVLYWPRPKDWEEIKKDEAYKSYIGTIDFSYESWAYAGQKLYEKCLNLGIQFLFKTPGYMLTQDSSGKVTGIIAKNEEGNFIKIETTKGVILATGNYCLNEEMVREMNASECIYSLRNNDEIMYTGLAAQTGAGQQMAVWAGGMMEPWTQVNLSSEPLLGPTPGVSINLLGRRWRNEDSPIWMRPQELRSQPGMYSWEIFDADWRKILPYVSISHRAIDCIAETFWTVIPEGYNKLADGTKTDGKSRYEDYLEREILAGVGNKDGVKFGNYVFSPGKVFAANTLEELADLLGFDADTKKTFLAEIAEYNKMCEAGADTRFGKRSNLLFPVVKPPFIACGNGVKGKTSVGAEGVMVEGNTLAVIKEDGRPIGGLWAAGTCAGGRHANQYLTPMSGMNHGFCVTLGKIAGESAAKA